ncbi:hypothetical protein SUVZ_04G4480 [Saccharomyces uvarum]|uniref:Ethanol regulator of translation 1 n=1 Tax=Saccharomyces uvarum TaxID=230603 RepID=A0ABN8WU36_SACUV|nr:hypothetical protein SUVZ_04G4480 [Saccharomyces uvarum]
MSTSDDNNYNTPPARDTPVDSSGSLGEKRKKRKNTNVACVNCSRLHVSCEAKRPCLRCLSKGLTATCVDAPRKKSKYLAGIPNKELPMNIQPDHPRKIMIPIYNNSNNNNNNSSISINNIGEQQKFTSPQHIVHKAKFLSNAADSEYSILSNIIYQDTLSNKIPIDILYSNTNSASNSTIGNSSNNSPTGTNTSPEETEMEKIRQLYSGQRANMASHPYPSSNQNVYSILLGANSAKIVASQVNLFANHFPLVPVEPPDGSLNFKRLLPRDRSEKGSQINWDASINQYYLNSEIVTFPELAIPLKKKNNHLVSVSLESCSPDVTNIKSNVEWEHSLRYSTPMEIYTSINAPFSHTPGFHHLLVYLKHRFNQQDLVKMCRSIAEFRPIFIACSVTLTEEDMIFMEQCYQRTLLEYVKFIGQIGTPTCIWRRNGQISYVNEEFEILSGWTREELLNKMTFVVEIMDDESVRDYFKTLSKVAYRDFKGSEKMKVCRLLSPIKGKVIQCCCMWTLKRDVSGLPLMILGNFMPILN